MLPGPFAYAESRDEGSYTGLAIAQSPDATVVIDSDSVILRPEVAELNRPEPAAKADTGPGGPEDAIATGRTGDSSGLYPGAGRHRPGTTPGPVPWPLPETRPRQPVPEKKPWPVPETRPKRFVGTVMLAADRPVRDMHQIVEAIVEQLATLPGAGVSLRLTIEADVESGLDRAKVRTLLENARTLGFIEKAVE